MIYIHKTENKGYEFIEADVTMIPTMTTKLPDAKQIEMMDMLVESFGMFV